jgi:voltage-gated potassium channel
VSARRHFSSEVLLVGGHTVVVGYGATGHAAVSGLLDAGCDLGDVVLVDDDPAALESAAQRGLPIVLGDATRSEVLCRAGVPRAAAIILATRRDDTNALIAHKARGIAARIRIMASVDERDNAAVLYGAGAASVIVPDDAVGRLLAIAATSREADEEAPLDLSGTVYGIRERRVRPDEVGCTPEELAEVVLAMVRGSALPVVDGKEAGVLRGGDRILYLPGGRRRTGRS